MLIYLIIGLILISIILQDLDVFFGYLEEGMEDLRKKFPSLSKATIRTSICIILVFYWVIWPISIPFLLYKEKN